MTGKPLILVSPNIYEAPTMCTSRNYGSNSGCNRQSSFSLSLHFFGGQIIIVDRLAVWRIFWHCGDRKRLYGWDNKVRSLQRKEKGFRRPKGLFVPHSRRLQTEADWPLIVNVVECLRRLCEEKEMEVTLCLGLFQLKSSVT